jgi:hypothetical protein
MVSQSSHIKGINYTGQTVNPFIKPVYCIHALQTIQKITQEKTVTIKVNTGISNTVNYNKHLEYSIRLCQQALLNTL